MQHTDILQVLSQDWEVQKLTFPESFKTGVIVSLSLCPLEVKNLA